MTTKNMWQTQDPAQVSYGGTGDSSLSPTYSVLCSGTTTTSPVQVVASVGTAGQVLTSNGAAALPTWQATANAGVWVLIQQQVISGSATVVFTGINSTYLNYVLVLTNVSPGYSNPPNSYAVLNIALSNDGGVTFGTDYLFSGFGGNMTQSRIGDANSNPLGNGLAWFYNLNTNVTSVIANINFGCANGPSGGAILTMVSPVLVDSTVYNPGVDAFRLRYQGSTGSYSTTVNGTFTLYGILG